ncbi:PTS transporter subunit EIIB [Oribacterium sp. P6A1]|uniref:PTS transporter subunit EIIB n=1 Tax=Oribacterium sp. P6A1 TaxID=1410612 RepID=UPI00055BDA79|nr:PTS transporter subunit EIIB [Oribacterium sp. P6A1]
MDRDMIMIIAAVSAVVAVIIGYSIYRSIKRKNADKLSMKIAEDDKLHITLDNKADMEEVARIILAGLGGSENVQSVDHDGARLKIQINEYGAVDEKKIRSAKVGGVLRPSKTAVHIIIGSEVLPVEAELKKLMNPVA